MIFSDKYNNFRKTDNEDYGVFINNTFGKSYDEFINYLNVSQPYGYRFDMIKNNDKKITRIYEKKFNK